MASAVGMIRFIYHVAGMSSGFPMGLRRGIAIVGFFSTDESLAILPTISALQ